MDKIMVSEMSDTFPRHRSVCSVGPWAKRLQWFEWRLCMGSVTWLPLTKTDSANTTSDCKQQRTTLSPIGWLLQHTASSDQQLAPLQAAGAPSGSFIVDCLWWDTFPWRAFPRWQSSNKFQRTGFQQVLPAEYHRDFSIISVTHCCALSKIWILNLGTDTDVEQINPFINLSDYCPEISISLWWEELKSSLALRL